MFKIVSAAIFVLVLGTPSVVYGQSPTLREKLLERRQEIREDIIDRREELQTEVRESVASLSARLRILRSGRVAIGSGEITAISGTTLTITHEGKSYTVLTDDKTQFRRKFWGKSELSEFSIGDRVNVIGIWEDEAHTTVRARLIRNLSIKMRHGVFFGTVTSKTDTGFVMDTIRRESQTVTIDENTTYINRRQQSITFDEILVGHRVRVRGLWNSHLSTITEVTQVKDFSLPPRVTPGPQATP